MIKIFISSFFLLIAGCRNYSTGVIYPLDQISFSTDKYSYAESDTINIELKNDSYFDLVVGLRCGLYLEMFYQKKENDQWSENLNFWYMSLRCPTHPDTIKTTSSFAHSISAEILGSPGNFRLLADVYISKRDTTLALISNSFIIEN